MDVTSGSRITVTVEDRSFDAFALEDFNLDEKREVLLREIPEDVQGVPKPRKQDLSSATVKIVEKYGE